LLFAGALVATSQMPGLANEAATTLRGGRSLQAVITTVDAEYEGGVANFAGTPTTEPASTDVTTTLAVPALAGSYVIAVVSTEGFVVGQWVKVGVDPLNDEVPHHIKAIVATAIPPTFEFFKPLGFDHVLGDTVAMQPETLHQQSQHQISSGPSASLESSDASSGSSAKSSNSFESWESGSSEGNVVKFVTVSQSASAAISWVVNMILCLCYACVYKSKVVEPMGVMVHQQLQHEMHNDFRFGLCDCWKDINICCMVMCCPLLRMAHTNETADVCGFWETLMCMWCSTLCVCGPLCLNVYFRIHIKDHMGIQDHCFMDLCAAFFCLPCITGQQAMSVDETVGWKFKCPCSLEHVSQTGGYGMAQMQQTY